MKDKNFRVVLSVAYVQHWNFNADTKQEAEQKAFELAARDNLVVLKVLDIYEQPEEE